MKEKEFGQTKEEMQGEEIMGQDVSSNDSKPDLVENSYTEPPSSATVNTS